MWSYECSCSTEYINMCFHQVGNDDSQRIGRHPGVVVSNTPCDGNSTSLGVTFYNTTVGVTFYWCTFSDVCSNFQEYNSTRAILVHLTAQPNISSLQAIPQHITIQDGEQYVYAYDCHYLLEDQELKMCYYRDGYGMPQPQFIDRFLQEDSTDVVLDGQCPYATLSVTITGTNRTSEVLFWFTTSSSCNLVETSGPRPIRITVEPQPPSEDCQQTNTCRYICGYYVHTSSFHLGYEDSYCKLHVTDKFSSLALTCETKSFYMYILRLL